MKKSWTKKLTCLLLVLVLIMGMAPAAAAVLGKETVIEVYSWEDFEAAFNYSEYMGESWTIKLMKDLYADARDTTRTQKQIIYVSVKGSFVTLDFNGHTLYCNDDVSFSDLEYTLADFIRIDVHPIMAHKGVTFRITDSVGGGGITMDSTRAYDTQLAALHVVENSSYYIYGIYQTCNWYCKLQIDGGNFTLNAKTDKFGRGTLNRDNYYRGCVIADDFYKVEVNGGTFTANGEGFDSSAGDMCARELAAFGTCCSTTSNTSGRFHGKVAINGGMFVSNGYSVHHFDHALELDKTFYMEFPIIRGGLFSGGMGYTGMTFLYSDGYEEYNDKPASDIIADGAVVMGVNENGKRFDSVEDMTLEDLHNVRTCAVISKALFQVETEPFAEQEQVQMERYTEQEDTFRVNYTVPHWISSMAVTVTPRITVTEPGCSTVYYENTDSRQIRYADYPDGVTVGAELLIQVYGHPDLVCGTTYQISVTEQKYPAEIVGQPLSVNAELDQKIRVFVSAENADGYRWYVMENGSGRIIDAAYIAEAQQRGITYQASSVTSRILRVSSERPCAETVYCVVTGTDGSTTQSDTATITFGGKPVISGFAGGEYSASGGLRTGSVAFIAEGQYFQEATWILSRVDFGLSTLRPQVSRFTLEQLCEQFPEIQYIQRIIQTDGGSRAMLLLRNVPEAICNFYCNVIIANDLGNAKARTDNGLEIKKAAAPPTITQQPEQVSCLEGGTLTYTLKAENMTDAQWYFTMWSGDDETIYSLEEMRQRFPLTTFTVSTDTATATLSVDNAAAGLSDYTVYAEVVGNAASTNTIPVTMEVRSAYNETEGNYFISGYRGDDTYAYPTREGYVFAGWYTDPALTQPLGKNVTTGTAYAKFVDERVLSIKWQVTSGTTAETPSTTLRLITTVDSLNYSSVGFRFRLGTGKWNTRTTTTVYSQIKSNTAGVIFNYKPTVFHETSKYFLTRTVTGVPSSYYDTPWTVVPFWVTLDGTPVDGVSRTFQISDYYNR